MTMTATLPAQLNVVCAADGETRCENPKGLVFYLRSEPPAARPTPAKPAWTPVPATHEVEVRRMPAASPKAEDRAPVAEAVMARPASGGWFGNFFKR